MSREQLIQLLKEELTIDFTTIRNYDGKGQKATIRFGGEEICSDYFITDEDETLILEGVIL